ncbi:MAG: YncE family protein [Actinoplanes sp.]
MSERALPTHVLTEIDSPIRESRLRGVEELTRIAHGADLGMAAAARLALKRLADDDSRSVAATAAAALERTAVRLSPERVDFGEVAYGTQRMIADVLIEGPPLAVADATLTVAGPGLRARIVDRRLRIMWQPRSTWLDGAVTVRGAAGWAEVRVTGSVTDADPAGPPIEEWLDNAETAGGQGAVRVTVLRTPPPRRRVGGTALVAGLAALLVLGGVGVAVALTGDRGESPTLAATLPAPTSAPTTVPTRAAAPLNLVETASAPTVTREPLAARVASVPKPTVIGSIRVGNEPEGVAVSPDGRTVYVANQSSRVLSVVDAATRKVTPVRLRHTPRFVAASRDGTLVFVSMYEDDKSGSSLAVIDAVTRKVVRYLATGLQPFALSVGPDDRVWVPIHSHARVEIYTVDGQRPDGQITVPPNPHAVAFSARSQRAFTADHESNSVAVIDMRTDKVLRSITVGRAPHSVAASPDGRMVLVAGYEAGAAHLIDAETLKRTGPFPVGRDPQSVAFAADSRHGYVVNEGDSTVSVLNGRTGAVTATIGVGRSPRSIAVSPDGRLAYVSNGDDDTISVLRVGE